MRGPGQKEAGGAARMLGPALLHHLTDFHQQLLKWLHLVDQGMVGSKVGTGFMQLQSRLGWRPRGDPRLAARPGSSTLLLWANHTQCFGVAGSVLQDPAGISSQLQVLFPKPRGAVDHLEVSPLPGGGAWWTSSISLSEAPRETS